MALTPPKLDDRDFDRLMAEARDRIPRFTPEWTNLNDSDPGMTLVKLHAWMTETILWELNRVPELNYIKFLDLVGIAPLPALPATTRLKAQLEKLDQPGDPLAVDIPLGVRVAVDDPALAEELVFETDASLTAVNADVGAVLVPSGEISPPRSLVTSYEKGKLTWLHSFDPLADATAGSVLYIGLLLRPELKQAVEQYSEDRMPAGSLTLYADAVQVFDRDPNGEEVAGPMATRCAGVEEQPRRIEWQAFEGDSASTSLFADDGDDTGWIDLSLSGDETLGLTRSGALTLELPKGLTPLSPVDLAPELWTSFGGVKPPQNQDELEEALGRSGTVHDGLPQGLADHWENMGVVDPNDLAAFAACGESAVETLTKVQALDPGTLDLSVISQEDWEEISSDYEQSFPEAGEQFRRLYWLRARVVGSYGEDEPKPVTMRAFHLNTMTATQAVTRLDEPLGRSDGRPAQVVRLSKAPVLVDPETLEPQLDLMVDGEPWVRVTDFFRSSPDDAHYLLDPDTGALTFGDGRRGRIPVAGAQFVADRYRTGGGAIGNVPEDTVTKIKGKVSDVKGVANIRPASGGRNVESLDDVLLRAPSTLRSRDRAVSASDFRDLAMETPGVPLHSVTALARRAAVLNDNDEYELTEKDGAVTLVVLPDTNHDTPQPTGEQVRAICDWLEPRRLITTELHVIGPSYLEVTELAARVIVDDGYDIGAVTQACYAALLTVLHPVRGGRDGMGWPVGEDIYFGDLYDVLLGVAGVRRVFGLEVDTAAPPATAPTETAPAADVVPVPSGMLPSLNRDVIRLVVSYG